MTNTDKKFEDHTDELREAANQLADRLDHAALEMGGARERLGRRLERVGDAIANLGKDARRPATGVARAVDDLVVEARRSFDRVTRPPRPWYERLMFWR